jgi:hypothetical protein
MLPKPPSKYAYLKERVLHSFEFRHADNMSIKPDLVKFGLPHTKIHKLAFLKITYGHRTRQEVAGVC